MLSNQAIEAEAKAKEEEENEKDDEDSSNNKKSKLKKTSTTPKLFNLIKKDIQTIKKLDSREVCSDISIEMILRDWTMIF